MKNTFIYNEVKDAYENNELLLLLSGDEKYISKHTKSTQNNKPNDLSPINTDVIFYQIQLLSKELPDNEVKNKFEVAFVQLLNGADEQKYLALEYLYTIGKLLFKYQGCTLDGVFDYCYRQFKEFIECNADSAKDIKIYNCSKCQDGLCDLFDVYSNKINKMGGGTVI